MMENLRKKLGLILSSEKKYSLVSFPKKRNLNFQAQIDTGTLFHSATNDSDTTSKETKPVSGCNSLG